MKLVFVRHCEPDYSIDSLTPAGWKEADLLADRVLNWKVDDFYVSPLGRAKDTAKVCLERRKEQGLNCEVTELPFLKEFYHQLKDPDTNEDLMCWDFMPSYFNGNKELHDKDNWCDTPVMKSGDIKDKAATVTFAFDKLLEGYGYVRQPDGTYMVTKHNDKTIVLFCHFGISSLLVGHLTGIAPTCIWQGFYMAPSSVTIVGTEERQEGIASFRVQTFGDTTHLTANNGKVSASGYFAEVLTI